MKKLIALLSVLVVLFTFVACSDIEPVKVGSMNTNKTENNGTEQNESGDPIFSVGDTAMLNDINVTLVGVFESTGSEYFKPADGKVFIQCEFNIENNSKEDLAVSSLMCFDTYCDDYACELSISAMVEDNGKAQLDGTVAPGKKMNGVVGYEVPENWQELEIRFTPDIMSNKSIIFVATNN